MSTQITPENWTFTDFSVNPVSTPGIKSIIEHGQLLRKPTQLPAGATGDVSYELAFCTQLDETHALIIVNLDEQGGGDLCVGNDGFVFEHISDIREENAIVINRVDPNFRMKNGEKGYLAKFPGPIGFIPLGAKLADGRDHPAAGTGFFLSGCIAKEEKQAAHEPETPYELIQLRWDGESLTVSPGVLIEELLGLELNGGTAITNACPQGESLLLPAGVADKICIFQFDWNGQEWAATKHGEPFVTVPGKPGMPGEEFKISAGEIEPSLQRHGDRFLLYTRGNDYFGRLYESEDGFNFRLVLTRPNHTVPQILNQGLDGEYYVATNPGPGMIRNPLLAYPVQGDGWGEALTIYDQEGIRGDDGDKIPFIDHCISSNIFLEGRWRHLVFFRVCDLKERTLHAFQLEVGADKAIYGDEGPLDAKLSSSGLYLAEFVY
jgi:hypothetical protein